VAKGSFVAPRFDDKFDRPMLFLRPLHYSEQLSRPEEVSIWVASYSSAHHIGLLGESPSYVPCTLCSKMHRVLMQLFLKAVCASLPAAVGAAGLVWGRGSHRLRSADAAQDGWRAGAPAQPEWDLDRFAPHSRCLHHQSGRCAVAHSCPAFACCVARFQWMAWVFFPNVSISMDGPGFLY
jgi:hypothetical protein